MLQLWAVAVVKAVWIPPRKPLKENVDYTHDLNIAKVSHWSMSVFVGAAEGIRG